MAGGILALFCALAVHAAEMTANGISIPFFDPAGKLTHRMTATRGSMAGGVQHLQEVEIVYFSATEPATIVQKLQAAQATWDDKKEILTGAGAIVVATDENRLTGEGFDFALATSLLHIHRNFTMANHELIMKSDRATVELVVDRAGEELKLRDVKRSEASGHLEIRVQPTAAKKYHFDHALSELAIYDGATREITLPKPIRYLDKAGREVGHAKTATIRLEK